MLTEYQPSSYSWLIVAGIIAVVCLFIALLSRHQSVSRDDLCVGCDEGNSKWVWRVLAAGKSGAVCAKCGKTWRAA